MWALIKRKKIAAWIGVLLSVIAGLAFFGTMILDANDLRISNNWCNGGLEGLSFKADSPKPTCQNGRFLGMVVLDMFCFLVWIIMTALLFIYTKRYWEVDAIRKIDYFAEAESLGLDDGTTDVTADQDLAGESTSEYLRSADDAPKEEATLSIKTEKRDDRVKSTKADKEVVKREESVKRQLAVNVADWISGNPDLALAVGKKAVKVAVDNKDTLAKVGKAALDSS
eukprot:TRINITY_DN24109_c1_g1_i3.p1 TRINITY_DN24109_c1_g1~~TRINITY_DN24109_c1_g1_i3.p1  ORF type:complete len:226 (-),score=32.78 TRINITY_DN24109_c1_g1_i3:71-748(-)